ncbi:MAG: 50S ribosomal protein L5 [Phycisphaerae bacterium]|nr:50S ribosomal protein L5 [Phycisphaerae bacterium]
MTRLLEQYKGQILPSLREDFGIGNELAVPRLRKVIVSMGLGKALQDKKRLPAAADDLSKITGQKAAICRARKSVSNFKLRTGYEIGLKVTLRGRRMYEFVDRLINLAIPRMRDFRGLSPDAFDGRGNYSMGIADQSVFPEIDINKVEYPQGMNITLVTSATTDEQARSLLSKLGMPFRRTGGQE